MHSTSPYSTTLRRIRSARGLIALGTLSILLLAGCSASGSTSSEPALSGASAPAGVGTENNPAVPGARSAAGGVNAAPGAQSGVDPVASDGSSVTSKPGAAALTGPKVTKSASLDLSVKDISASAARVRAVAAGLQGQVLSEQIGKGGPNDPMPLRAGSAADIGMGTLTLSVPAAALDTALDQLARIGTVLERTTSSQDVTAQYVDTQSRLKTMRASVERVRALLSQAKDIGQVVAVESELTRREADLESLESQLSALKSSVQMSPVTVILTTPAATPVTSTGFLAGLRSGWDAFTSSATGLITVIGTVLPFAAFIALIGAGLLWWWRRRQVSSATQVTG